MDLFQCRTMVAANMDFFRGLLGIVILIAICMALSNGKRVINWRLVIGGILLQIVLAALILKTKFGIFVGWISNCFVKLLSFSDEGAKFMFGDLIDASIYGFAFKVLPTILFISALTSVLYYLGVLQKIVYGVAWVMKRAMRLSGAESLAAAANIFVGQAEAPLVVKPYISKMTRSEIMSIMTGGMATIAGGVFGLYIAMLGGENTEAQVEFGRQLLTASFLSAPAALVVAKILVPETEEFNEDLLVPRDREGKNLLDALSNGTIQGLTLALNVAAMLIVFIAMIAMVNWCFGWVGGLGGEKGVEGSGWINGIVNSWSGGVFTELSLQSVAGFLFAPFAWVIGANPGDLLEIGQLLGTKMFTNEFVAYRDLGKMIEGEVLEKKSIFLATFALCGFANFSSIGIQIGGIGSLAPDRRGDLAELGFKAMIGGTIACLITACIAGMFF